MRSYTHDIETDKATVGSKLGKTPTTMVPKKCWIAGTNAGIRSNRSIESLLLHGSSENRSHGENTASDDMLTSNCPAAQACAPQFCGECKLLGARRAQHGYERRECVRAHERMSVSIRALHAGGIMVTVVLPSGICGDA